MNAASAPAGASDMRFTSVATRPDNTRFNAPYSPSTGVVSVGGFKDVVVHVAANVKGNLFNGAFNVFLNGCVSGRIGTASALASGPYHWVI